MWGFRTILGLAAFVMLLPCISVAQDESGPAMLSIEASAPVKKEPRVTAVYGVSANDYLPHVETARKSLRPKIRSRTTRPSLDLPDSFYFIGSPIFIIVFLRVLVIFINGFEEKRKEELRTVTREVWDAE